MRAFGALPCLAMDSHPFTGVSRAITTGDHCSLAAAAESCQGAAHPIAVNLAKEECRYMPLPEWRELPDPFAALVDANLLLYPCFCFKTSLPELELLL